MSKKIDLKRSVYELTTQYPELIEVLPPVEGML